MVSQDGRLLMERMSGCAVQPYKVILKILQRYDRLCNQSLSSHAQIDPYENPHDNPRNDYAQVVLSSWLNDIRGSPPSRVFLPGDILSDRAQTSQG